jgi:UDP-glucose 4-epimerase
LLLASSSEVYGKSGKEAFSEEDDLIIGPPRFARWGYACSKLMDEFLALAYARERGLRVVIARLFNTVGPRQTGRYGMVLPRFIAAARAGTPLRVFGDGQQTRCFCYVDDVVEALVRLAASVGAPGGIFNVGSRDEISIKDLAQQVIDVLGSSSAIELIPYDEAYPAGFQDLERRRPVIQRLTDTTKFEPATPLRVMIQNVSESLSHQQASR